MLARVIPHHAVQREAVTAFELAKEKKILQILRNPELSLGEKSRLIKIERSRVNKVRLTDIQALAKFEAALKDELIDERDLRRKKEEALLSHPVRGKVSPDDIRNEIKKISHEMEIDAKVRPQLISEGTLPGHRKRTRAETRYGLPSEHEVNAFTLGRINQLIRLYGLRVGENAITPYDPNEDLRLAVSGGLDFRSGKITGLLQEQLSPKWKQTIANLIKKKYPAKSIISEDRFIVLPTEILPES